MDYFSQYGGHEASSSINVPPRVESITDSSSSESVSDTAGTSPFLNAHQLPLPNFSKTFTTEMLQPTMQEEQNAFASTSAQPAYYPMPTAGYMSFQAPFSHNPSAPPSPPSAAALSQNPSPIPIPNPSTSMPVPMPMPLPELTPPVPVTNDVRDSGVDFGIGIRPPSQAASTAFIATEPPLFRARSLLGFAKSQSRLGFVRPRPPTATTVTSESSSESDLDSDLNLIQPHYHTWDESTRALIEGLRPVMESCIEIVVRLIPTPQVSSAGRLIRLPLGREEAVCASMEGTLRHLWGCITLRPGCACPSEGEQEALSEGERGSDVCREFHEAFERKLRRFTTRMRTFHEQINRPRRMHRSSFTERLLGWQDAFDQWINRFERLNAYLRLRLAHAHAKQIHLQLEDERTVAAQIRSHENSEAGSASGRRSSQRHRHHHELTIQQLREDYDLAKGALLEAHKRSAGLAWRRDGMGQLVRDFGNWTIRDPV
ncbi:hypothetical protein F5876DRAFT_73542 [Lentinula aff. lateritia]|uniref:Uncharacterized protein n=1 Tax=Lentinula aff. lateritia TaxID=2804960 RepID=A0ACC1U9Q6_9AGAR|nr:hypothetical protein F5876DRAFT_73542 [Lentinula aff. lateritia]